MNSAPEILTVRGRPVGYRSTPWGGEVFATERGYFPVSSSGYYSLSGRRGSVGLDHYDPPTADFLEQLAQHQDAEHGALVRRCEKHLRSPAKVGDYIAVSLSTSAALDRGFFARDVARRILWQLAYQLCDRVMNTPEWHPVEQGCWTPEVCASAIQENAAMHAWLRDLLQGRVQEPPILAGPRQLAFHGRGYLELPERIEPVFELPARDTDFGFDIPVGATESEDDDDRQSEEDSDEPEEEPHAPAPTDDGQLTLL